MGRVRILPEVPAETRVVTLRPAQPEKVLVEMTREEACGLVVILGRHSSQDSTLSTRVIYNDLVDAVGYGTERALHFDVYSRTYTLEKRRG